MNERTAGEGLELWLRAIDRETVVIEVVGAIDGADAPLLKRRIEDAIEAGRRRIVVDMSDATFIDSVTIAVLVAAWLRLRQAGCLVLVVAEGTVSRILRTAGVESAIEVFATRDEAIAATRRGDGAPAAA